MRVIFQFSMWLQLAVGTGPASTVYKSNQVTTSGPSATMWWTTMSVTILNMPWLPARHSSAWPSGPSKVTLSSSNVTGESPGRREAATASVRPYPHPRPGWDDAPPIGPNGNRTHHRPLLEVERVSVQIQGDNWVVILFMVVTAFFMGLLMIGDNYAWKKGALEWA